MERAKWDYDFRETKLKGYFRGTELEGYFESYDFEKIFLHRIGTWYAVKMGEHYDLLRARDDRGWGENFFGL